MSQESAHVLSLEGKDKHVLRQYEIDGKVKSHIFLEVLVNDFTADSINQVYIEFCNLSSHVFIHRCEGENIRIEVLIDNVLAWEGSGSEVKVVDPGGRLELSL